MQGLDDYMITILGAGMSGLAAAITLARAGYAVRIYEKGMRPKPGFHTAVHAFRNYGREQGAVSELSQLGIDMPEYCEIYRMYKFSPDMKRAEIVSTQPQYYTYLRGKELNSMDQILLKQAEKLGVELIFGETNKKKADIIATGASKVSGVAYGKHYENVNAEKSVHIFFNDQYAPHGYLYVLPYGNSADVIIMTFQVPEDYGIIREYFQKAMSENSVLQELLYDAEEVCEVRGIGDFDVPLSAVRDGSLYVGEAAGFQDGSNGFGSKYAILSGYLAARSMIEDLDYDELWKEALLDDLEYYFKRGIVYQPMDNKDFKNYIEELGETTTKEAEEKLKAGKVSNISDSLYYNHLSKWQHKREI